MNGSGLKHLIGMLSLAAAALLPAAVMAFEVTQVWHGGTVEGTVTLSGAIPEPKGFNLDQYFVPCIGDRRGSAAN